MKDPMEYLMNHACPSIRLRISKARAHIFYELGYLRRPGAGGELEKLGTLFVRPLFPVAFDPVRWEDALNG